MSGRSRDEKCDKAKEGDSSFTGIESETQIQSCSRACMVLHRAPTPKLHGDVFKLVGLGLLGLMV